MVKLLTSYSGAEGSHHYGEVVTLDKGTEERLVASGQAEVVEVKKAPVKK